MSDYVDIVVDATPDIVEVVVENPPAFIEVVNEQVIERVVQEEIIFGETPAGTIDGSNATFTTAFDFVPGKVAVFLNGLLQKLVTHYNTTGTDTIIFNDSPVSGDIIEVNYIKQ